MDDMLAGGGPGVMHEIGMQRRLPVVDVPLGNQRGEVVGIEIDGIASGVAT
jgi:hypothetical protein